MNPMEIVLGFLTPGFAVGVMMWIAIIALFQLVFSLPSDRRGWKCWEGSIVTAIKLAEKEVPATVHNAGLARLERALAHVTQAYRQEHRGRQPSKRLLSQLRQAIQLKHDDLDRCGRLGK